MPLGSIQFWIVSLIAGAGLFVMVRQFRPVRKKRTKTQLTISAKKRD